MGYMRHHVIVVTSWKLSAIEQAHRDAVEIFPWVSPISFRAFNDYRSFFVPPDGSKEGWKESDDGDELRSVFLLRLDALRYDDGSSPLSWVEIQYGDDEGETVVIDHSDRPRTVRKPEVAS